VTDEASNVCQALRGAAEAKGWEFDATLGRWTPPAGMLAAYKEMEKFVKELTDERIDAMGTGELREHLEARDLTLVHFSA